jgi:hypothetical protein
MNWTSTTVPLWHYDCQNFWRAGTAFEVRDVTTAEHRHFVDTFAATYGVRFSVQGTCVRFDSPKF